MAISLAVRNAVFFVVHPGLVIGLIPYLILRELHIGFTLTLTPGRVGALLLFLLGLWLLISCIFRFGQEGRGTLSPIDPTRNLVTSGPYRYSRNPMYVGVMCMLIAESIFFRVSALWWYAAVVFVMFNLFIVLHEEPRLKRVFGEEYEAYRKSVRRWI